MKDSMEFLDMGHSLMVRCGDRVVSALKGQLVDVKQHRELVGEYFDCDAVEDIEAYTKSAWCSPEVEREFSIDWWARALKSGLIVPDNGLFGRVMEPKTTEQVALFRELNNYDWLRADLNAAWSSRAGVLGPLIEWLEG